LKLTPPPALNAFPRLPTSNEIMKGPTFRSNQLIPGMVYNGREPIGYGFENQLGEVKDILNGGITTFVCLVGEKDYEYFINHEYPS
jgi:hypothetical protein